ncbi:molybdopterin converting factor subunit 1 [Mesorhizobium xinjiangense]|uniref:molybdopterin converting factor subunit 1 n=1 Tax=Mesorhizobium xinjiangense TaxID=2678685 RepID=UPI0012ECC9D5|nr:molybdopterin converting factor subunit 1 [Mesorhizobium xinjiangense]
MKLVYFAWVRERIGKAEEEIALPAEIGTVGDLLSWLQTRGATYEAALQHPETIRVAIDHEHVEHHAPLSGASEIALFPPMTGG